MISAVMRRQRGVTLNLVRYLRGQKKNTGAFGPLEGKVLTEEAYGIMKAQQAYETGMEYKENEISIKPIDFTNEEKYAMDEVTAEDLEKLKPVDPLADYRSEPFICQYLETVGNTVKPTYNMAALAEKVEVLQKFVGYRVPIHKWDQKLWLANVVLKLDWSRDCEPKLNLLKNELNLIPEDISRILTKNPLVLSVDPQHFDARLRYLREMCRGDTAMMKKIITKNPRWLSLSIDYIEEKLDLFRRHLCLSDAVVRALIGTNSKIIRLDRNQISLKKFSYVEEFGFTMKDLQQIVLRCPKLLLSTQRDVKERFDLLHNKIGYSHEMIANCPNVLLFRINRFEYRYDYLRHLERDQFDPTKPCFVSLESLVLNSDEGFAVDVAKTSIAEYQTFLRTR